MGLVGADAAGRWLGLRDRFCGRSDSASEVEASEAAEVSGSEPFALKRAVAWFCIFPWGWAEKLAPTGM